MFFVTGETTLTQLKDVEHTLELTNYTPIRQRAYNTDIKSQEIIDETVDELLSKGLIEVSQSERSSPVVLVRKKR